MSFPRAEYNMTAATCNLDDISDTPDPRTNKKLLEAQRLLHIALEQQAESSASHRYNTTSRPS